jgi:hypothetical protein
MTVAPTPSSPRDQEAPVDVRGRVVEDPLVQPVPADADGLLLALALARRVAVE